MSERKNIEKLFQEKFSQFEVYPDEIVWENIEKELQKKKEKKRVVPFWFQFGGLAASLILGFWILNSVVHSSKSEDSISIKNEKNNTNENSKSVVSNKREDKTKSKLENDLKSTKNEKFNEIVSNNENKSESNLKETIDLKSKNEINKTKLQNNSIVLNEKEKLNRDKKVSFNELVVNQNTKQSKQSDINTSKKSISEKLKLKNQFSNFSKEKISVNSKKDKKEYEKPIVSDENKEVLVFQNKNKLDKENPNEKNIVTNFKQESIVVNEDKDSGKSLNDKIYLNEKSEISKVVIATLENKKLDSTKIAKVEFNALEELLSEKEQKLKVEQKVNRWQVSPNIAPIYFGSITQGSPLDERLTKNDKEFSKNQGYGLGISYGVSKKIKIRTGINVLSLNYITNGVIYSENSEGTSKLSSSLANLNPNALGAGIRIENLTNVNPFFGKISNNKSEGSINQKMGYIEVPVEMSYKILNKKFTIELISGISGLYLNKNDVMLKTTETELKIGEASNLNKIHFSSNLGLGLKYNFIKNLAVSVEPTFKYQINTFSSDSGNFKPYIFGIYSGVSLTF